MGGGGPVPHKPRDCLHTYGGQSNKWCAVGEAESGVGDLYRINHVTACACTGGTTTGGVKWEWLSGG